VAGRGGRIAHQGGSWGEVRVLEPLPWHADRHGAGTDSFDPNHPRPQLT
jgi:hypothetical protein